CSRDAYGKGFDYW
nr:immunoglobulin heavy chain junction region [Macaca mulatta]